MLENIFDFLITILIPTLTNAVEGLNKFLFYRIPLKGLMQFFINVWEFFGSENVPDIFYELISSDFTVLSLLGGSAIIIVLILVIVKKIIPLF